MSVVVADDLSLTFAALADPTRRSILERLAEGDATVHELAEPFALTQQAVSKHLKVMERAGLISRTRVAQSRPCRLEPERLDVAAAWIERHREVWADRYDQLERAPDQAAHDAIQGAEAMNKSTDTTELGELTYTRVHDAPPELLFDCMTQPEHLTHFWGPTGTTTPVDKILVELRPGGRFETVMVNDETGDEYPMRAIYVEIDRPRSIVWREADNEGGMLTTITFTDIGGGRTEVVTHQTNVPSYINNPEAQAGFLTSLDRNDAYLKQLMSEHS